MQNKIHRGLAKSRFASFLAVKLRNQANCVIAYHLGETSNSFKNGEFALITNLAAEIQTFIDVGANVGAWSEFVLKQSNSRGFLFEPSSQCFERLNERFRNSNVSLSNVAVGEVAGISDFAEEENFGETSSLADAQRHSAPACIKRVRVVTLDEEFREIDTSIDFLKIDTEGYDLKVIKGAKHLLTKTRFVQFEYNSSWVQVGASLAEAMRFLEDLGFSVLLLRSTGLHPFRYEFWGDFYRYSNFFACRQKEMKTVRRLLGNPI